MFSVASPFAAKAQSGSRSQRSRSVAAARCQTTSGRADSRAWSTALQSVTSVRAPPATSPRTSYPPLASASASATPSIPRPPVTNAVRLDNGPPRSPTPSIAVDAIGFGELRGEHELAYGPPPPPIDDRRL